MKFPTLSKAHMQQNVSLALGALVKQGITLEGTRGGVVTPRDVVEGHREKTFGLLWKLVLNWKITVLLDLDVLESEIAAIKAEYKRQHGMEPPERVVRVFLRSCYFEKWRFFCHWRQDTKPFFPCIVLAG